MSSAATSARGWGQTWKLAGEKGQLKTTREENLRQQQARAMQTIRLTSCLTPALGSLPEQPEVRGAGPPQSHTHPQPLL